MNDRVLVCKSGVLGKNGKCDTLCTRVPFESYSHNTDMTNTEKTNEILTEQAIHELAYKKANTALSNGKHKDSINTEDIAKSLAIDYVIAKKYLKKHAQEFEAID